MPLWSPSKIFTSLRQILKLSSVNSSTHTAMASWGLSGNWWLGIASTIGGVGKRFKKGKKKDEWVKGPWKKKKKAKEIYNSFITVWTPTIIIRDRDLS